MPDTEGRVRCMACGKRGRRRRRSGFAQRLGDRAGEVATRLKEAADEAARQADQARTAPEREQPDTVRSPFDDMVRTRPSRDRTATKQPRRKRRLVRLVVAVAAAGFIVALIANTIELPESDNRPSRMELSRLPDDREGPEYIAAVNDPVVFGGLGAEHSDIVLSIADEEGVRRLALVSIADGRFERRWFGPPLDSGRFDAAIVDDGLYIRHDGGVIALDHAVGTQRWSQDVALEGDIACFLFGGCIHPVGGGHVAVATPDKGVAILDTSSGDITWTSPTGVMATAGAGQLVTAHLEGTTPVVTAVAPSGEVIDSTEMGCSIASDEILEVHGLSHDGDLIVSVNWGSCVMRWAPDDEWRWGARASAPRGFYDAVIDGDSLYSRSREGGLQVIDLTSGETSDLATDLGTEARPIGVAGDVVVVATGEPDVETYAGVNRESGQMSWGFEVPASTVSASGGRIRFDDDPTVHWAMDDLPVVVTFDHKTGLAQLEIVQPTSGQVRRVPDVAFDDQPDHRFGMVNIVGITGEHLIVFNETTGFTALPLADDAPVLRLDR